LVPPREWWIYILAVFPAHIVVELNVGMPFPQMLVAFATNCAVAIFNAFAMRTLLHAPPWFGSLRKSLLYIVATAFAGPAIVAFGGAFVPVLGGGAIENYSTYWLQWYLSNALSSLTLGPLALIALSRESWLPRLATRQRVEGLALAIALVIICMFALRFSVDRGFDVFVPALALLPLTIMIWSAIRFGATGASASILIVTMTAIEQTLNGPSPFIVGSSEATVLGLQMFLIVLAVPVLLLGAATEETRHAMSAARQNQELMVWSTAAADVCLWQYNRRTEHFWMTENGRSMFGLSATGTLTRAMVEETIHPEDREVAIDAVRAASRPERLAMTDFRIILRSGDTRWIRARSRAREGHQGDLAIVSGTFSDITQRKATEQETALKQAEMAHFMRVSMLGELSGGIAHELTQPLTAILSNAQAARLIIEEKSPNLDEIRGALDDIISDDNRAAEVLRRMRSFLKRGDAKFESIDLGEIIGSTLQLLHSELINRGVKITSTFDETLPLVCGDRIQLQQVFLNLFMNALDSMDGQAPAQRTITISTRSVDGREAEVRVTDSGAGLSRAHEEMIFQPFFTTKERGLGLGLLICSSIIKAHGGRLGLENNPDGGAVAIFALPCKG
jgi:PAS domain S-box-containing protein